MDNRLEMSHKNAGAEYIAAALRKYRVLIVTHLLLELINVIVISVRFSNSFELNALPLVSFSLTIRILFPLGLAFAAFINAERKTKLIKYVLITVFAARFSVELYSQISIYINTVSFDYSLGYYSAVILNGAVNTVLTAGVTITFLLILIFNNASGKKGAFIYYSTLIIMLLSAIDFINSLFSIFSGISIYFIMNTLTLSGGLMRMAIELLIARGLCRRGNSSEVKTRSRLRFLINVLMATAVIPFLLSIPVMYVFFSNYLFYRFVIVAYIMAIIVLIRFKLCNPFTVPVGFTLLPLFVFISEVLDSSYGLSGQHSGSLLSGMLYAFPIAVITLIIANINFWSSKRIKTDPDSESEHVYKNTSSAFVIAITVIIIFAWIAYLSISQKTY